MSKVLKLLLVSVLIAAVVAYSARPTLGRTRPDLAALISFDDGLFGFAETYTAGQVGPFDVGDTRSETVERLRSFSLLEEDQAQLRTNSAVWRLALPAKSGGWAIYTLSFDDERITSVKAYYSLFAGL